MWVSILELNVGHNQIISSKDNVQPVNNKLMHKEKPSICKALTLIIHQAPDPRQQPAGGKKKCCIDGAPGPRTGQRKETIKPTPVARAKCPVLWPPSDTLPCWAHPMHFHPGMCQYQQSKDHSSKQKSRHTPSGLTLLWNWPH